MLIICTGADTWRAADKARELGVAFRQKYDQNGTATTRLTTPTFSDVLNRFGAPSLFSTKQFIRADGWMEKVKPTDLTTLLDRITRDADITILVTVVEELGEKIENILKEKKILIYGFPEQHGAMFRAWCEMQAKKMGCLSPVFDIAEMYDGDSWSAMNEIKKRSANPHALLVHADEIDATNFEISDAVLTEKQDWRNQVYSTDDADGIVMTLLSSLRCFFRIRDGYGTGIHPYVQKKMQQLRIPDPKKKFLATIRALIGARTSRGSIDETILDF